MPTNALNITLATPGGSRNSWGGLVNNALQVLDDFVADVSPIGTIHMWSGATPPTTTHTGVWLLCDGSAVSQATYPDLYSVLSPLQAQLDPSSNAGSGNFRIPDLRGRLPLGYINNQTVNGRSSFDNTSRTIGASGGNETSTLSLSQIPTHTHTADVTASSTKVDPRDGTSAYTDSDNTSAYTGNTASSTTGITDSGHSHSYEDYGMGDAPGQIMTRTRMGTDWYFYYDDPTTRTTSGGTANLADPGHSHTVSGTLPNLNHNHPISVEVTNQNTGGTGTLGQASSHSIVNPYYVVNFIILAKVPRVS